MKSEQEFLTDMWAEITAIEREAEEKRRVHELNRRLFFKNVTAYAIVTAVFIAGSFVASIAAPAVIYAVVFSVLGAAFYAEKYFTQNHREGYINEN